jgi:hypothetical protein
MINSSGGFNDQYDVPLNRIAYCRKDLDHVLSLLPHATPFFLERQTKQAIVELANTFLDQLLDAAEPPHQKASEREAQYLLRSVAVKFPELKEEAMRLYELHLRPERQQQ